ncbi:hypothetical protein TNCV_781171 [Trichonephila clavipes]|nr:hypothetical protein TNCV_781171 [Trichonephila clavipes]
MSSMLLALSFIKIKPGPTAPEKRQDTKTSSLYLSSPIASCKYIKRCFQSVSRRDSFSKQETNESHLMRDQDCMVDDVEAAIQELRYGFALALPCVVLHCHPTTKRQI